MGKKKEEIDNTSKKLNKKQKLFIEAFASRCACNVSATCKAVAISRRAYYKWLENNPTFKEAIELEQDSLLDMAETKLQQNIMEGKEASIFFFLKTKGKKRGYVEATEHIVDTNPFIDLMKSLPNDVKE